MFDPSLDICDMIVEGADARVDGEAEEETAGEPTGKDKREI